MNFFLTHLKFSIACLFLAVTLCLSIPAHAAKGDYEVLVERNLELREQLQALEQKYSQLENERSVLIGHVRNLQQEKEKFPPPCGQRSPEGEEPLAEESLPVNAPQGVPTSAPRDAQLQAALDQMNEKLGFVTQERDQLQKELGGIGEENEAKIKTLESENAALSKEIEEVNKKIDVVMEEKDQLQNELTAAVNDQRESQVAVEALGSEKAALDKQLAELNGKLTGSQSAQKDMAIERAFLRAQAAGLMDRERAALAESDHLKAEVQRLTRVNEALKDAEQKWRQARRDLDALRAGSRKAQVKNKKLENKLAKMKVWETRSQKNEEELKALRMLQKEHEAMIGKLSSEKSTLEAGLSKLAAPMGAVSAAAARQKGVLSPANKQRLDMHFNLAVAYDKTKMYKAEEREYLECLRIDSSDANVHYNLGILYDDKLNDNAKAIKHYRKFLRLRPMGEDSEQVKEWIMHAEQQQRL